MSKFSKRIGLAVVFALSMISICAAQQTPSAKAQPRPTPPRAAAGRVTSARLAATIPARANCPITMHFNGTITTNGPAEVKYTWVSSDGGTWPEGTLKFVKAGSEKVSQQLEQGAPGSNVHGWLQLKVVSPNTVLSNKVNHNVICTAPPKRK